MISVPLSRGLCSSYLLLDGQDNNNAVILMQQVLIYSKVDRLCLASRAAVCRWLQSSTVPLLMQLHMT